MLASLSKDRREWEAFLKAQRFSPFLQSWTMGEVFHEIGQLPIRFEVRDGSDVIGICQAIVVPARRGKHLMVQYGPVVSRNDAVPPLLNALEESAREHGCSFVRLSPFWEEKDLSAAMLSEKGALFSPLHLLSEYTWYIPLTRVDRWNDADQSPGTPRTEDEILADMRKTTRNLVRRAEREGVEVEASKDPLKDLDIYFSLQEETWKRHKFVPYKNSFIRAQVKHFSPLGEAVLYVARYRGEPVAASVHMSYGGITSYHHGASTQKYAKIPASYLLQWTAIKDALRRGDGIYNFWGIAPRKMTENGNEVIINARHPFAGVTTFKTGFGGKPLPLIHCVDIPISPLYRLTRAFEFLRKWKRGF